MEYKIFKKVAVVLRLFVVPLCILAAAGTALAAPFPDVPVTHTNSIAIQSLKDSGVISGYADGMFKPDNPVSRAEALAIILKGAGIVAEKISAKIPFTDVPETAWYYPVIQNGYSSGKLKGYADNTFRPDASVTLPEALAMTVSFFGATVHGLVIDTLIYGGLDSSAWYAPFAQYAKNQNLIEPDELGFVSATEPLTRAELAEIVYRMMKASKNGSAFDITTGWITEEYAENHWKIKRPTSWEVALKGTSNSVLIKRGSRLPLFFTRIFPDGARLSISLTDNADNVDASAYFSKLKEDYSTAYAGQNPVFEERILGGQKALWISVPGARIFDCAVYLPNKQILIMYGEYGSAPIGEYLKKQMQTMVGSYGYVEKPLAPTLTLEERTVLLRENILIKDAWKQIASLFPDKKLISTDAIGIGTGPVDYYFTAEANLTIKLERESGTILNVREGSTSAF